MIKCMQPQFAVQAIIRIIIRILLSLFILAKHKSATFICHKTHVYILILVLQREKRKENYLTLKILVGND